jgi:3-methyladenine DNA glycosylase AlkD
VSPAALAKTFRAELRRSADPTKAAGMQAYMKSAMPYLGVPVPQMRAVCKQVLRSVSFSDRGAFHRATLEVWRGAKWREERYAAIEITGHRCARDFQTMAALPLYEELIVTGAWWDYVDTLASRRLGPLLAAHPGPMKKRMLAWSRSGNIWKRRSAILCQLHFKEKTDLGLLYACIEPALHEKEFFLRKAIGWALREHAWTDPREVKRYVKVKEPELSPLSKREALKNL